MSLWGSRKQSIAPLSASAFVRRHAQSTMKRVAPVVEEERWGSARSAT